MIYKLYDSAQKKFCWRKGLLGIAIVGLIVGFLRTGISGDFPSQIEKRRLSAGEFTIDLSDNTAFSEPAHVLSYKERKFFMRGRVAFNQKWVVFPLSGGDWGLGPTFVADRCSGCHVGAGRGNVPTNAKDQLHSMIIKISIPGKNEHGGPRPHPHYGDQIQNRGLVGEEKVEDRHFTDGQMLGERVRPEADLFIEWDVLQEALDDGTIVTLRKPKIKIENLNFGRLGREVMYSLRIAQPLYGLGLLEAVSEEDILAGAKLQEKYGISGKANFVWNAIDKKISLGRFGWKANVPSIRQQTASAFLSDLGVTTSLFKEENCPPIQVDCAAQPPGNNPELIDLNWNQLVFWTQALAVPAKRNVGHPDYQRGEELFIEAKCSVCHLPELKTANQFMDLPKLANQAFHPYTDMLLHDMGHHLADNRPEFLANGREWRTPPLWGLGLSEIVSGSTVLLHDGRARNVTEAILWHGGEAEVSRKVFKSMKEHDRKALIFFLKSI